MDKGNKDAENIIGVKVMAMQNIETDLDIMNGAHGTIFLTPDEPLILQLHATIKLLVFHCMFLSNWARHEQRSWKDWRSMSS